MIGWINAEDAWKLSDEEIELAYQAWLSRKK